MINPLDLPNKVLFDRSSLPAIAAIYFVVEDSTILYVGSTINLKQRWLAHHKYKTIVNDYPKAKIHYYCIEDLNTLRSLEAFFINEFSPVLNLTTTTKNSRTNCLTRNLKPKKTVVKKEKTPTDNSGRIRIKANVANKVREMATGLNMSFLEVLYYAVNTFYLHHYAEMRKFKAQPQTITPVESKEDSIPETLRPDSDDTCELDIDI